MLLNGEQVYSLPKTPGDHRWYRNAITDLIQRGVLKEDPKKAGQRKTSGQPKKWTGGESPPPLPPITKGTPAMSVVKDHTITAQNKDDSFFLFQTLMDHYKLKIREGRMVPHGSVPILALIIEAYEADTGDPIPSFNYTKYDVTNRHEIARLCANRASDILGSMKNGEACSTVTVESLTYSLVAVDWFDSVCDWKFPNGQTIAVSQRGITVMGGDVSTGTLNDDPPADVRPPIGGMVENMQSNGFLPVVVSMERAKLALEVAASIEDMDIALALATRILETP